MYPHFIEVHTADDGQPISVNVENILMFYPDPNEKGSYISFPFTGGSYQDVTETYSEVKALIEGCGCLIHKADPRLDTTKPLTMEDLKGMIGEPVWNSNDGRWYLIHSMNDDCSIACLYRDDGAKVNCDDGALIAKPMYRMKQ